LEFNDTLAVIESLYTFTPVAFKNGELMNAAGQNSGSCKLFAFAQIQNFSVEQTLACFGAYYRNDVLENPEGSDHMNIRNFMRYGWHGIQYQGKALTPKQSS
ncbi:MAG: HopJ type III effector protein, partial [Gammaproteobacteria bacterium]|nr:HopJ type III effector protein [Gammaproteobacteria bacterium]